MKKAVQNVIPLLGRKGKVIYKIIIIIIKTKIIKQKNIFLKYTRS